MLARKSKEENNDTKIVSGIFGATAMMYLRILILAWIFNADVALKLAPYFLVFVLVSLGFMGLLQWKHKTVEAETIAVTKAGNPLEFKTALIFGLLFGFFAILTNLVIKNYGNAGVNTLSFIVGVTDIDPYILNLFQHVGANLQIDTIVHATVIATASNSLIKMIYCLILGSRGIQKYVLLGFSTLVVVSAVAVLLF
jgi:uncharacterized membrane protein (DUF4010 family)